MTLVLNSDNYVENLVHLKMDEVQQYNNSRVHSLQVLLGAAPSELSRVFMENVPDTEFFFTPNRFAVWSKHRRWLCHGSDSDSSAGHTFLEDLDDLDLPPSKGREVTTLQLVGNLEAIREIALLLQHRFPAPGSTVRWMYTEDGRSLKIPLRTDNLPTPPMYPFLPLPLSEYYQEYDKASASVLLLMGPAGTGKTSFIRGYLHQQRHSALLSYDPGILSKDKIFTRFLSGQEDVLVLEDADHFLLPREDGNQMMHRLLSVADGLLSLAGKKMIFSTNLESRKKIDPALLRPGRCFDIVQFRSLTGQEAVKVLESIKKPKQLDLGRSYRLAELLNPEPTTRQDEFQVGFQRSK